MCDYSLEHLEVHKAEVGDELITTMFSNSITRGFTATQGDPFVVVCLFPGTELKFETPVKCDYAIGFFPTKTLKYDTARFRKINADQPHEHHDALEFPNGEVVLLTRLVAGQRATVLQLPRETPVEEGQPETAPAESIPAESQPTEPAQAPEQQPAA